MLKHLMDSPIAWAFLSFLTLFSVVFAIFVWASSKTRKQFSVSYYTDSIIAAGKKKIKNLTIQYDNRSIMNLSSSKFYIWNSGNAVINSSDIVESKPLSIISSGEAVILDAQIIRCSDETNKFEIVNHTDKAVELTFDYVDRGDGIVLQLFHTESSVGFELDGKIKGGEDTHNCNSKRSRKEVVLEWIEELLPYLLGYGFPFSSIFWINRIVGRPNIIQSEKMILSILILVSSMAIGIFIGVKLPKYIKQKSYKTIPKSLF